jgi:hypothetical protein
MPYFSRIGIFTAPRRQPKEHPAHEEVAGRVRECARAVERKETNCIGTGLYTSLEIDEDRYVNTLSAHTKHLSSLRRLDAPAEGCLITWQTELSVTSVAGRAVIESLEERHSVEHISGILKDNDKFMYTLHLGVVTALRPMRIRHRRGYNGRLEVEQTRRAVERYVENVSNRFMIVCDVVYYLPRALESVHEIEQKRSS